MTLSAWVKMKLAQRRVRRYLRESRERRQGVTGMAMVRTNPDRWQATCRACGWQSVGEFTKVRAAALRHEGDHQTPSRGRSVASSPPEGRPHRD